MIAQQRLPIHMAYLQPHLTSSETKASPLALLAATCSSIGKPDNDKKDIKATSAIFNSLSSGEEEHKSSFKPYKMNTKPANRRSSPPALRSNASPILSKQLSMSSAIHSKLNTTVSMSESERSRFYPHRDSKDYYPLPCHSASPPLPHLPHKTSMLSPHHNHSECVQCKKMGPHSDMPAINRQSQGTQCPCFSCTQTRTEPKCNYPAALPSLYPSHYKPHLQPMITCRDPTCTNCSKAPPSHTNIQNFLHPALIHQCTHGGGPHKSFPPPPLPHLPTTNSTFDSYAKASSNPKPFVCNWVSDGKHCGNGFTTSEELFQHLRTHTNLQQHKAKCDGHATTPQSMLSAIPPPPPTNSCTVHGCPCGQRKASPRPTIPGYSYGPASSPVRYSPYSRPGHGYVPPPHSVFHY